MMNGNKPQTRVFDAHLTEGVLKRFLAARQSDHTHKYTPLQKRNILPSFSY